MRPRIIAALAAISLLVGGIAAPAVAGSAPIKVPAATPSVDGHGRWLVGNNAKLPPKAKIVGTRAYGGAFQFVGPGTAGVGAEAASVQTSQHNPWLDASAAGGNDVHTLFELAAQSNNQQQIVEIGWRRTSAAAANPVLFSYSWVNGVGQGYAGVSNPGWIDNPTEAVNAGTALAITASGASPTVFYEYKIGKGNTVKCDGTTSDGTPVQTTATLGWLVYQQNVGSTRIIGCYPLSVWSAAGVTFDKIQLVQAFDEIALVGGNAKSCSDMGSGAFGVPATPSSAQWVKNPTLSSPPAGVTAGWAATDVEVNPTSDSPTAYRVNRNSSTDFRVGGPGWNAARTATGSIGAC